MHVLILSSSPNRDGLTSACAAAAAEGIRQAGAKAEEVRLNDLDIGKCQACGQGWGSCLKDHVCQVQDGFQALHGRLREFDAFVVVTPVYWGEASESARAFLDRVRRCEATQGEKSAFLDKRILAVAAAGGTGNGTVTCLLSLDNWIKHVRGRMFELIGVTRWSRPYKLVAIHEAACAMVKEAAVK